MTGERLEPLLVCLRWVGEHLERDVEDDAQKHQLLDGPAPSRLARSRRRTTLPVARAPPRRRPAFCRLPGARRGATTTGGGLVGLGPSRLAALEPTVGRWTSFSATPISVVDRHMSVSDTNGRNTQMCAASGECVDIRQRPTPASLRARIAETRVRQWRVARRLDVSDVHLSHVLVERIAANDAELVAIAAAVEAEAEQVTEATA